MSAVAGRMAVQAGAAFLEKERGGKGVLLGGVPGVQRGHVVIIGGGIVGSNAAKMAVGLGAHVTVLDINAGTLTYPCTDCHVIGATTAAYPFTSTTNDWTTDAGATTLHGDSFITMNDNRHRLADLAGPEPKCTTGGLIVALRAR